MAGFVRGANSVYASLAAASRRAVVPFGDCGRRWGGIRIHGCDRVLTRELGGKIGSTRRDRCRRSLVADLRSHVSRLWWKVPLLPDSGSTGHRRRTRTNRRNDGRNRACWPSVMSHETKRPGLEPNDDAGQFRKEIREAVVSSPEEPCVKDASGRTVRLALFVVPMRWRYVARNICP